MPTRTAIATGAAIVLGGAGLCAAIWDVLTVPRHASPLESYPIAGVAVAPLLGLAVWLGRHRPEHPQTLRLLVFVTGLEVLAGIVSDPVRALYADPGGPPEWFWALNLAVQCIAETVMITGAGMLATYPDGVVEVRWQRVVLRLLWLHLLAPPALLLTDAELLINPYLLADVPAIASPWGTPALHWLGPPANVLFTGLLGLTAGIVVFWVRFVHAEPAQRARMRAMVRASAVFAPPMLLVSLLATVVDNPVLGEIATALISLTALALPVIIVVGIVRHRIFEVDAAVRRSLAFGALSLVIGTVYLAVVATPGLALGERIPLQAAVLITIAVAMIAQPLRTRLEALASRLTLGRKIDRYRLLTDFGARVEQALDTDDLLPQLATTVRAGLAAEWVRVRLPDADATAGPVSGPAELSVDLRHRGTVIGHIECGPTATGYTRHDRDLLATLAQQSAVALANVELAARLNEQVGELARSRARVIAAQDTERARIERDLHDGAQQQVAALVMKMRLIRNQLSRGDLTADGVPTALGELQRDATALGADLRELAQGIHPAVLVDHGLVAAVQARADRLPIPTRVTAAPAMRDTRLDPRVETAAYFVVSEALANVAKHAAADTVTITVDIAEGMLRVMICDDGTGIPPDTTPGRGQQNMRDRVEAPHGTLRVISPPWGGTIVSAEIPIEVTA